MYQSQMSQANPPSGTLHDLLSNYSTVAGPNDELLIPGHGAPALAMDYGVAGQPERRGLAECGARRRRWFGNTGVVYNVYSDAKGMDRPWALDMLPVSCLRRNGRTSSGAKQRLHLMNAMLRDPMVLSSACGWVLPHAFTQANRNSTGPPWHRAPRGTATSPDTPWIWCVRPMGSGKSTAIAPRPPRARAMRSRTGS